MVMVPGNANTKSANISDSVDFIEFQQEGIFKISRPNGQFYMRNTRLISKHTLAFIDNDNRRIWFWNLREQSFTDSIFVDFYVNQRVTNFRITSEDSLLIAFEHRHIGSRQNQVVQLRDSTGKLKPIFNFRDMPVPFMGDNTGEDDPGISDFYYIDFLRFPLVINPQSRGLLTPVYQFQNYRIDSGLFKLYWSFPNSKPAPFKVRKAFTGQTNTGIYPKGFKQFRGAYNPKNSEVVFGTGFSPKLVKYNIHNHSRRLARPELISINTVKPYDSFGSSSSYYQAKNEYRQVVYDQFQEKFWRVAQIGYDSATMHSLHGKFPVHPVMLLDDSLHKTGEGFLPPGHTPPIIPYKKGLLVKNAWASDEAPNTHIFSYLKWRKRSLSKESFKALLEKRKKRHFRNPDKLSVNAYLDSITSGESCSQYLLIPLNGSTRNSLTKFASFLKQHDKALASAELGIILLEHQESGITKYLTKHGLQHLKDELLFIDTTDFHKAVFSPWINVKYLAFDQNGQKTIERTYHAPSMKKLFRDIKETKH